MALVDHPSNRMTFAIVGAAMVVHRELGGGFLEAVYQEALETECRDRGIPCDREREYSVRYRGHLLKSRYRADLICFGAVIVEVKAIRRMAPFADAQLINYLKASGLGVGLLLNFGGSSLSHRRFLLDHSGVDAPTSDESVQSVAGSHDA